MKTFIVCLLLLFLGLDAMAQEKAVASEIQRVTVFLSKAQVAREVKTNVPAGKSVLVLTGLSSMLDPESIQVGGKGKFMVLGVGHRQNYLSEVNRPKPLAQVNDSLAVYQRQLVVEQHQLKLLQKEEELLLSNQKIGGVQANISVAELRAMADFYRSRLNETGLARIRTEEKTKKINERIAKLNRQAQELNELYRRNTSEVVVDLSAESATTVSLEVSYVVSGAGWNPLYDIRAVNTSSPVQVHYKAQVYQRTGEEWKDVSLTLSTANPDLGGRKPELGVQYADFYEPVIYPVRRQRSAAAPAMAGRVDDGVEMEVSKAKEEMPEMDKLSEFVVTQQASLNTEFVIKLPYTVPSSNAPVLVDVRQDEMKATYQYAVVPKLDPDVFLMARATGWESLGLMPGQAQVFFEGTYVGKTYIDPAVIRDTLSLSLGRDKRIVVKRERKTDFKDRNLIGSNRRELFVWEISARNSRNESISLSIEDQVPVSRNSQIEVTVTDTGGAKYQKETGKLKWELSLKPNELRQYRIGYEVKYPKDRKVSGL